MKILITGANGYVGKSLTTAFSEKYQVTTISRKNLDLLDIESLKKFFKNKYFDVVIHCAVKGGSRLQKDEIDVLDSNLIMFYNLLFFKSNYGKFIHFGSGAEDYMPNQPYGFSKRVIKESILDKDNFYNLKIFNVFDENEMDTRFMKANIIRYINASPIQIYQNKLMDFFYMGDLIKLVEYYFHNKDLEKEIECVYSQKYYLSTIAEKINQLNNYRVEIKTTSHKPAERYIGKYMIPYQINFIGFEEGLKKTYKKLIEIK